MANMSDVTVRIIIMEDKMNIDDLTLGQLKEIKSLLFPQQGEVMAVGGEIDSYWKVGANYLIRTVTMINTGRLVKVTPQELILEEAAWVADTGRFSDSLISCSFSEVEPFPADKEVIIGRAALIDAVQIDELPRKKK